MTDHIKLLERLLAQMDRGIADIRSMGKPAPVRRKGCVERKRPLNIANRRHPLGRRGKRRQRAPPVLRDFEQELAAIGGPRVRHMGHS